MPINVDEGGWRSWVWLYHQALPQRGELPNDYETVDAYRAGWDEPVRLQPDKLAPEYNVAGLYWRPIGAIKTRVKGPEDD